MLNLNLKTIQPKEYEKEVVDSMNGWLDLVNDPRQLPNDGCTDTINIVFTPRWYTKRPVLVNKTGDVFSAWTDKILAIARFHSSTYKYSDTVGWLSKTGAGSWTTLSSIAATQATASYVTWKAAYWGSESSVAVASGTTNSIKTAATLTVNDYVGKYLKVSDNNTMTHVFWLCLITSNTANEIFVEWTFDRKALSTDFYTICTPTDVLVWLTPSDNPQMFFDVAWTPTWKGWNLWIGLSGSTSMEWFANRLWVSLGANIWFSNLWTANYFQGTSFISVWQWSKNPALKIEGNRLVIYADDWRYDLYGDSPENFQLVKKGEKTATSNTLSGYNNIANGANTQYFLSNQWLEMLQMVDATTIAESIPISTPLYSYNQFGTYSKLAVLDNRVYLFDSNPHFWTNPTTCWVYDIRQSLANGYATWSRCVFPKTITAVWFDAWEKLLYIAYDGVIAYFSNSGYTDWDSAISCTFSAPFLTQKDIRREKDYFKWHDEIMVSGTWTIAIYQTVFETWTKTLLQTVTFTSATSTQILKEIDTFLNIKAKNLRFDIVVTWDSIALSGSLDSMLHQTLFTYLPEPI